MKKLSITLLLTLTSIAVFAQCGQITPPPTPTDFVVVQSRPNSNVHLNWNTVREACTYKLNLKLITKVRGGYIEQQAFGYPIILQNDSTFPQQDLYDFQILNLIALYNGTLIVKYELSATNDVGSSLPIYSEYIRIK